MFANRVDFKKQIYIQFIHFYKHFSYISFYLLQFFYNFLLNTYSYTTTYGLINIYIIPIASTRMHLRTRLDWMFYKTDVRKT